MQRRGGITMPKIVCINCRLEYVPDKNGITAEEFASFGSYKLWSADIMRCPGCGHRIIGAFGNNPFAIHHQIDYNEKRLRSGHTTQFGDLFIRHNISDGFHPASEPREKCIEEIEKVLDPDQFRVYKHRRVDYPYEAQIVSFEMARNLDELPY